MNTGLKLAHGSTEISTACHQNASISKLPTRGESGELFSQLAMHIIESGIQGIEVRKSKNGMRLAARLTNDKLQNLTGYFPYISPVYSAGSFRYFYAGEEGALKLHTITLDCEGVQIKELAEVFFSLKEIVLGEHIGSGIIEYMIPREKLHHSETLSWETQFVDLGSNKSFHHTEFSFEPKNREAVFVNNNATYIIGRSFDVHDDTTHTECVLVLPKQGGNIPFVLGKKWFGQILPARNKNLELIGFDVLSM